MKFIRALTMVFISFGLFVQFAAHAAVPQYEGAEMTDCAEMARPMSERSMDAADISSAPEGRCPDMTVECLIAMNCLPPLASSAAHPVDVAPLNVSRSYHATALGGLESELPRPESPPPQITLTV